MLTRFWPFPGPDCKSLNKKEIWIFSTNLKFLLFKITILRTKFYRYGEFSMTYSSIDYDIFCKAIRAKLNEIANIDTYLELLHAITHAFVYTRRTFANGGRITIWLVSSLTGLDSVVSVHTSSNIFSCLIKSNPVKLETTHTRDPCPYGEWSLLTLHNIKLVLVRD